MNETDPVAIRLAQDDNGPVTVGVVWFLCAFAAVFLGLRLYAKITRQQGLWWDDYILITSWVLLAVESAIVQACRELGMGKHTWLIPAENRDLLFRLTFTGASISCFAATFSKISFGVTLLRLTKGKVYAFVWFSIIGLFIVMLPSAMLTWIQCRPTAKLWISSIEGSCWPPIVTVTYGYFNTAFCVIVDFALALIPWMVLRHLKLHTREKIGLGIAMSMGFFAGVCAIVKGLYLKDLTGNDFFFKGKDLTIWTSVETATAIVGASIPVLRVYLKNSIETLHDRYHRTDYEGNTVTVSAPSHSVAIPLSIINPKSAKWSSVHSITEMTSLRGGTPPENDIIVQTNTVTIEYFPQRQRAV